MNNIYLYEMRYESEPETYNMLFDLLINDFKSSKIIRSTEDRGKGRVNYYLKVNKKLTTILFLLYIGLTGNAQNLSATISAQHGAGCDNQSGILTVSANGGNGAYTYLWTGGLTTTTITGLGAGTYSVEVNSGSETINVSYTLNPFGVLDMDITNSCSGNPGSFQITALSAQPPCVILWYNSSGTQIGSFPSIYNLQAGEYSYSLTDADGCVDSSSVVIQASNPVLEMFAADSVLCYGEATEVWFTPGFILYDGLFPVYDTSTDTLTWINQMSGNYLPNTGIDQYGCWATVSNDPILYSQPEPWPMLTIYNYGDTISLDWGIDENPDPIYTYNWYLDGVLVESYAYSYLAVQVSGTYSVQKVNQYGCYNTGVISITVAGIIE
ncbi:MAG: hypothetical protein EBS34_10350, partial [Flavobacteriales bacterium]|nr:hypothetical protein [Flavobacteriales bacterium]